MGCSVSQRGCVGTTNNTVLFEGNGSSASYGRVKIVDVVVDDYLFTAHRKDLNDPPFEGGLMGLGDQVTTMDGSPEIYGGGGDVVNTIKISVGGGTEFLSVSALQLIPAKLSLYGWVDIPAKDLTTDHSVVVIDFSVPAGWSISRVEIIGMATHTTTVNIYHPLFDDPSESTYYAAIENKATNNYGILVATCEGEF